MSDFPEIPPGNRMWANPLPAELRQVDWDNLSPSLAHHLRPIVFGKGETEIYISGNAGRGKTYAAACVALLSWKAGLRVSWWTVAKLLADISDCRQRGGFIDVTNERGTFEVSERGMMSSIRESAVIVLDDLGSRLTEAQEAILLNVVNQCAGKRLIVTSNWTVLELAKRIDHRIVSRIAGGLRIEVTGPDRRLAHARTVTVTTVEPQA